MGDRLEERRIVAPQQVQFEYIPCPVCEHGEFSTRYSFADPNGAYSHVRCDACGYEFLNPRPTRETISTYYAPESYQPFLSSGRPRSLGDRIYAGIRKRSVRWKRRQIARLKDTGSVLDLGCGTGEFLEEMKASGWDTMGVEPSTAAVEFATLRLGLKVLRAHIDDRPDLGRQFDVITMWHSMEHVHRLSEGLNWIHEVLSTNGLLFIAVPNIASRDAKLYGRHWVALDPPRHLHHFSPTSMDRLLSAHGFRIEKIDHIPLDTLFNVMMSEKNVMRARPFWHWPWSLIRGTLLCGYGLWQGSRGMKSSTTLYAVRRKA